MKTIFILLLSISLSIFSCRTVKDIPEDLSSAQLIQRGQNAYGLGQYKSALTYYQAVLERYGTDTAVYVEAKYEIAHLYMKQKKYDKAYTNLKEILDIYEVAPIGSLPAGYQKLAKMDMDRIPENKLPKSPTVEIKQEEIPTANEATVEQVETENENTETTEPKVERPTEQTQGENAKSEQTQ